MKLIIQLATISCLIIIVGSTALNVLAASDENNYGLLTTAGKANLVDTGDDLPVKIGAIINGLLSMIGVVFLLYAIYGGFQMITSQGDQTKVVTGRKTIVYATMGVIVVASAFALSNFILGAVGGGT